MTENEITVEQESVLVGGATYTAGDNIQISEDNVISATDTTYTAGTNVSISEENVISATDTIYDDTQVKSDITNLQNNKADKNEIPDVSNFITKSVDDLVNYYKKSETYTQTEVNNLIGAISTLNILVVEELPTQDISTNTIYFVPKTTSETNNVYDEYIYVSNNWELIGTTEIDLSNYVTKTDYATSSNAGVINTAGGFCFAVNANGNIYATAETYSTYTDKGNNMVISKGTLENVLTGKNYQNKRTVTTSSTSTYTIASLTGNNTYKLGEITSLTITASTTFDDETNIYFTSGSTATSISIPDTLVNIGDAPTFTTSGGVNTGTCEASKNYIVSICNNVAIWKNY